MEYINASITPMVEIEIFGIPALYTPYKVSRQTVHLGLCLYELQAGPEDWEQPRRLFSEVEVGFHGTVLTLVPLEISEDGLYIGPEDITTVRDKKQYTPAEFEDKYLSPSYDTLRLERIYGKTNRHP